MPTTLIPSPLEADDDVPPRRRQADDQPILPGGPETNRKKPEPKNCDPAAAKDASTESDGFPYFDFFPWGYLY